MNEEREVERLQAASMYIISGATRILFDGRYRMHRSTDGRRVLAFNKTNDLELPPDASAVMPLKAGRLPGTLIGIKFSVQANYLREPGSVALASGDLYDHAES